MGATGMSTSTLEAPVVLTPHDDPTPVEQAAVNGIAGGFPPETFLWIVFYRPDGGARVWYSWTAGGAPLGNAIDRHALAQPLDAADWFHILDRHLERSTRGRIKIDAYPLRPILADLQAGVRAPDEDRAKLLRVLDLSADMTGQARPAGRPLRWVGVGPDLLNSRRA